MCRRGLQSQCETTQVSEQGLGASLFGYTSLYGSVPGGQAEYLRVPQAQYGPVRLPQEGLDDLPSAIKDVTDGRGADRVIDAVGMEAHGNPVAEAVISATTRALKPVARTAMETVGIDRLGQANVRRWTDELLEAVSHDDDPFDVEGLATHRVPLADAPEAYRTFRDKEDGCIKVVLTP